MKIFTAVTAIVIVGAVAGGIKLANLGPPPQAKGDNAKLTLPQPTPAPIRPKPKAKPPAPIFREPPPQTPPIGALILGLGAPTGLIFLLKSTEEK